MKPEQETLEACLAKLRALEPVREIHLKQGNRLAGADGTLILHTDTGQLVYSIEVKPNLSGLRVEHLLLQLERYSEEAKTKPLLLSDYIPPRLAERLIQARFNFVDAAGNVYIQWPGKLHIQIQGHRPTKLPEMAGERLSQPSGLKVLYALLVQAPKDWGAYRDIAKAAGVALGSIAIVMRELKGKGYLVQKGRDEWRLSQKRKLLDLWVDGYSARLRPDLLIGRYQTPAPDPEQTLQVLRNELEDKRISWALTGGFAADILTRHFRGEQVSMFVEDWPRDVLQRLRWLPSAEGRVAVLRKFSPLVSFDLEQASSYPVAHPLLVYAELIFQGRERELETAKILYDRYLTKLIREDGT